MWWTPTVLSRSIWRKPSERTLPGVQKIASQDANRLWLNFRHESGQMELNARADVDLDRVVSLIAKLKFAETRSSS